MALPAAGFAVARAAGTFAARTGGGRLALRGQLVGGEATTVGFRISTNYQQWSRWMTRFEQRQIPFATLRTVNDLAFEVRTHIVKRVYPASFPDARNRTFPRIAFKVGKARNKNRPRAFVGQRQNKGYFLPLHESGTDKTPYKSSLLKVPNLRNVSYTKGGRIAKRGQNDKNQFIKDFGRGPAIWQRTGRKGKGPIKLMFYLKPVVRIDERFPFYEESRGYVVRNMNRVFIKNWRRALATARR